MAGERDRTTPVIEMFRPYGRIVILHVCILAGGFLTVLLGLPTAAAMLLIVMKTAIDVVMHSLFHQQTRTIRDLQT